MRRKRWSRSALFLLLASWSASAPAQSPAVLVSEQFQVDPQHSTIGFTSLMLGAVKVRGRFGEWDVAVTYDAQHVEHSSVTAMIAVKSITTDMDFRDNHLRSADFFDTDKFPTIEFQSDSVVAQPGGVTISGPLTMHGVTRRITFSAQVTPLPQVGATGGRGLELEAHLHLSRADFGIAGTNKFNPSFNPATNLLSDRVEVDLELDTEQEGYLDRKLGDLGRTISDGQPPGVVDAVTQTLEAHGVAAAVEQYRALRATQSKAFDFGPEQLNVLGHVLEAHGRIGDALKLLALNAEVNPTSSRAIRFLAEAQALSGDGAQALATYRRAAAINPISATAREMIRRLTNAK
jgi:polyisoprenoid-binding protein YceI